MTGVRVALLAVVAAAVLLVAAATVTSLRAGTGPEPLGRSSGYIHFDADRCGP